MKKLSFFILSLIAPAFSLGGQDQSADQVSSEEVASDTKEKFLTDLQTRTCPLCREGVCPANRPAAANKIPTVSHIKSDEPRDKLRYSSEHARERARARFARITHHLKARQR